MRGGLPEEADAVRSVRLPVVEYRSRSVILAILSLACTVGGRNVALHGPCVGAQHEAASGKQECGDIIRRGTGRNLETVIQRDALLERHIPTRIPAVARDGCGGVLGISLPDQ